VQLTSAEYSVPNLVHAVLITSTIPSGGSPRSIRATRQRVPGVIAVMTHKNAPKLPLVGSQPKPSDRKLNLLQDDSVYYDNQPIGVVNCGDVRGSGGGGQAGESGLRSSAE